MEKGKGERIAKGKGESKGNDEIRKTKEIKNPSKLDLYLCVPLYTSLPESQCNGNAKLHLIFQPITLSKPL